MARYRFSELIDVGQLDRLLELFHRVVGVPISIADVGDAPIIHVGWQDVCVNFHRAVDPMRELCLISDAQARNVVLRESCFSYRCLNGLENVAVPILIEGEQLATLFVAQYFYDDTPIDFEFFREHARRHGVNEEAYIEAVKKVPVFSREKIAQIKEYCSNFASFLAACGYSALLLKNDLARHIRSEKETREKSKQIESLLESLPAYAFYKDAAGVFRYANRAFCRATGCERVEGKTDFDFSPPDIAERYRAEDRRVIETGEPVLLSEEQIVDGGQTIDLVGRKVPVKDDTGRVVGILGIGFDITERKRLEARLKRAEKLESLGLMAGGIAHDFNNLLLAVMGHASLLTAKLGSDPALRRHAQKIEEAAHRAADLAKQMLAYSGKSQLALEEVQLTSLVREVLEQVRPAVPDSIALTCTIEEELPVVEGDPAQLKQALLNVITNAVEAIEGPVGEVEVSAGRVAVRSQVLSCFDEQLPEGRYVYLLIKDSGPGIKEQVLGRMFDPFYSTKSPGRGLGLSTVHGIVRGHRGAVAVETAAGRGSTFRIYLPYTETRSEEPAEFIRDKKPGR